MFCRGHLSQFSFCPHRSVWTMVQAKAAGFDNPARADRRGSQYTENCCIHGLLFVAEFGRFVCYNQRLRTFGMC